MKTRPLLIWLALSTAPLARADAVATTPAVGYQKLTARGASDSRLSLPLVKRAALTGRITFVSANALTLSAAAMEAGAFAPGADSRYYVQFVTGNLAGLCVPVLNNTSVTISLAMEGVSLTSHPLGSIAAGVNGDIIRLRPFWSVADVLGHDVGSLLITPVDSLSTGPYVAGDAVLLPDVISRGTEKRPAATLNYVTQLGWRTTADPVVDAASTPLPPGRPFTIRRQDLASVVILILGDVPSEPLRLMIPAVGVGQEIDIDVALAQPIPRTLALSALYSSENGHGVMNASEALLKASDVLLEFDPIRTGFALPAARRFHVVGSTWYDVVAPADDHVLQPGRGYVLRLRGERPARYWLQLP